MRAGNALTSHERTGEQPHCAVGSRRLDALLIRQPAPGNPRIRAGAPARMGLVADGAFDDSCSDDVGGRGAGGERPCGAGLGAVEGLDVASGQQPGEGAGGARGAVPTGAARRRSCRLTESAYAGPVPAQDRPMGITYDTGALIAADRWSSTQLQAPRCGRVPA